MKILFAAIIIVVYLLIKKLRGSASLPTHQSGNIPNNENTPKGTYNNFVPGVPLLENPSNGNWYQTLTEQCSGIYPVTYDTSFRVYYGTDCNVTNKIRVQMSWTTEDINEVVGTYDSGYQMVTEVDNVNGVHYIENNSPISIPINASQANLKVHATASFWSENVSSQPITIGYGTTSIMYPCN